MSGVKAVTLAAAVFACGLPVPKVRVALQGRSRKLTPQDVERIEAAKAKRTRRAHRRQLETRRK